MSLCLNEADFHALHCIALTFFFFVAFEANFEALITQADSLYSESGNLPASISLLRSALELCPNCKAPIQKGQLSEKVFVFDNFADRRLLSDSIFPVLQSYKPKRILWVGIQVTFP